MGTFTMPSLGADMAAGTLVEWLKLPGDTVEHGDIIAVVETDKGAIEVEVFESGVIGQLLAEPGSKVPVGTALALINGGGEPVDMTEPEPEPRPSPPEVAPPEVHKAAPAQPAPSARAAIPLASPAARKAASERGIDLASLTGSGPGGAVQLVDLEKLSGPKEVAAQAAPDLSAMRRAIASAMAKSKREIPHYYLMHSFDVSPAIHWLDHFNAVRPPPERLLLGVLLLKAVALALVDYSEFNGFYQHDAFVPSKEVNLGSAIAIRGGGLAAPCIHNTDQLSLADLMTKLRELITRTRRGQFRSSEISDATATVSSLGERGVESLWPIIYPPQVAIIGFGSVQQRAWGAQDAMAVRPVMTATLAGDHRANDGHRGALFLRRVEELLSQPEAL